MNEYYNYEDCSRIQGQCLDLATIILFQWHPGESVAFKSMRFSFATLCVDLQAFGYHFENQVYVDSLSSQ